MGVMLQNAKLSPFHWPHLNRPLYQQLQRRLLLRHRSVLADFHINIDLLHALSVCGGLHDMLGLSLHHVP